MHLKIIQREEINLGDMNIIIFSVLNKILYNIIDRKLVPKLQKITMKYINNKIFNKSTFLKEIIIDIVD